MLYFASFRVLDSISACEVALLIEFMEDAVFEFD